MKICLAVCEYNPLHNGHAAHLAKMKGEVSPDFTAVIMSGNFTQRGEVAVMDKYTRARHALLAGADIVFELPAVFATANAEIFAKGAVKLLNELPGDKTLCFGAENADAEGFYETANMLSNESRDFKKSLKTKLKQGFSFAKAKYMAAGETDPAADTELMKSPNNILGVEYTRAIIESGADISILPVPREGAGHNDDKLQGPLSSASAIRKALKEGKKRRVAACVPSYVFDDLPNVLPDVDALTFYSLISHDKKFLSSVLDCTEGLENRIKSCLKASLSLAELKEKVITKRYTAARINRIMTASLLGITRGFIEKCMRSELYLNVLAVKQEAAPLLAEFRQNCKIPLITRKNDVSSLRGTALECFKKDAEANDIRNFAAGKLTNEYLMLKM